MLLLNLPEIPRKMKGANSTEFNAQTKYPVIDLMESQRAIKIKGGTMRLGAYDCELKVGTRTHAAYQEKKISERHRHRYEFNNKYKKILERNGLIFSGINKELKVVETIELKKSSMVCCESISSRTKKQDQQSTSII